jgi:hypothetical protein
MNNINIINRHRWNLAFALVFLLSTTVGLSACGERPTLEACRLIEIEDAEVEIDLGDVDVERGEVEMVCDGEVLDVSWGEFRDRVKIDPGRYQTNLRGFEEAVTCFKEEGNEREVLCRRTGNDNFVALSFSYDD